jgi:hypothetical protein
MRPAADKGRALGLLMANAVDVSRLVAEPLSDMLMKADDDARNLLRCGDPDMAGAARVMVAYAQAIDAMRSAVAFAEETAAGRDGAA